MKILLQNSKKNAPLILKPSKAICLFLMVLFFSLFGNVVSAQTNTWDGSSDNNWNLASNWSLNLVPTPAHDVIININAAISVTANSTINSLTISGSAAVSLTSSGGGRTITIGNTGSSIGLGSSLTLQGSTGNGTRSMSIRYTGTNQTMSVAGTLILTDVGEGTIYNATNSITTVTGTIINNDSSNGTVGVISSTVTNLIFASGGTYKHELDGGAIPTATWSSTSNCNITGFKSNDPTNLTGQIFGNLIWNCAGQTANMTSPSAGLTIAGNLTIQNSSTFQFRFGQPGNNTIGGDFIMSGGNARISSGTLRSVDVAGSVIISAGTLDMSSGNEIGTLNVNGNFTHTGGTITETGSASGLIVFNKAGTQTYTSGGTVANTINFTVNSGSTLQMATPSTVVTGNTFVLSAGATIGITSTAGITTAGTATGNIQTTTRTFNTGASYIYNGTSAQAAGTGLPATVSNLTISNATGVTLARANTVTNNFSITSGSIANLGIFSHTAGFLTLGGEGTAPGSWGSTSSSATNKDNTYFAAITGIVNNSCAPPTITSQPVALTICENTGGSFSVTSSGASFQWQYSINNGSSWTNTTSLAGFSGHTIATLTLAAIPLAYNGYYVRCIVRSSGGCRTNSSAALLTVNATPTISGTVTPAICSNDSNGAITITGLNVPIEFKKADNDNIDLGSPFLSGRSAFTIEGWVKFNIADVGARMSLFGQNDVIEFFLNTNTIQLWTPGGGSISATIPAALGNNSWHHIAATGDGINLKIYIDGVLLATGGSTTTNYGSSTNNAQIGSGVVDPFTTPDGGFTGQIEKVGFYSTALLQAAITSLSATPTTYLGTETGLIAGYNFSEGSGTTLTSLAAGKNGTFGNSPQWAYTYAWTKTGTPAYTASTKDISSLSTGDYNLSISTLGGGCPISKTFTVGFTNTAPSTPIVDSITQPNCKTATGSVTLSSLPAGNWTINPGGITGNTTSTNISGLAVGTYNFSVTNASGCTSSVTADVVINAFVLVTNTWDGSAWSTGLPPTAEQKIVFSGDYPPAVDPAVDIVGCSCTVNTGVYVDINAGRTLTLTNELIVDGNILFKDTSSLVQINDVANTGDIEYERKVSTTIRPTDYTYWSSPVAGFTLGGVYQNNTTGNFYSYGIASGVENWQQESSTKVMDKGIGYIISGATQPSPPAPPSINLFSGLPNNGDVPVSISFISSGTIPEEGTSNLLGNPYPSAIDADKFLIDNASVLDGTLYFWTHNTALDLAGNITNPGPGWAYTYSLNDYASYNLTGGVGIENAKGGVSAPSDPGHPVPPSGVDTGIKPTGKIAAGQGFFATGIAAGTATFKNDMRVAGVTGNNSQFFKTRNPNGKTAQTKVIEKNRVWLNLTNTEGAFKQTLIGYITNATNNYETLFDGESFDGNEFLDFYSVNQDKNLVIQGRALPFDAADEVPLGFRTTINGAFTINIDQTDGLFTNQDIFIEDKLTNTTFDLKSGNYTFNTVPGTFNDRFVLKYSNKTLSVDQTDIVDGILAFYSNKYNALIIHNETADATVNSVALFNIAGQNTGVWDVSDSDQTNIQVPIKNISSGIYIVKVTTTKGESSKKIIVN